MRRNYRSGWIALAAGLVACGGDSVSTLSKVPDSAALGEADTDAAASGTANADDSVPPDASAGAEAAIAPDTSIPEVLDAQDDTPASDGLTASDASPNHDTNDVADMGMTDSDAVPRGDTQADTQDAPTAQRGCAPTSTGCYTVYAHTDHVLFYLDLVSKALVQIGPFNAPQVAKSGGGTVEDVITDLAVTPDDRIWVISGVNLYRADPATGHVTLVSAVTACAGNNNVALDSDARGALFSGDSKGNICQIDMATQPATVSSVGTLGNNLALAGDFVTLSDGSTYGTGYHLAGAPSTIANNALVTFTPTAPTNAQSLGLIGYGRLFGVAYGGGKVLAFTHDGTGNVIAINPMTGAATVIAPFTDPTTGQPAQFGGAGVNPRVLR